MQIWEYIVRIAIALVLGGLIGLERNRRVKEAGIRTHGIVAFGACIFMLVSQFAINKSINGNFDATRIASTIVTGVGFLGVGIIYNRSGTMQGLTTAAGVWATAAIGMCCGAGERVFVLIAVIATLIIILFQFMFHRPLKWLAHKTEKNIKIKFIRDEKANVQAFRKLGKIITCSAKKDGDEIVYTCVISLFNLDANADIIEQILCDYPSAKSVEFLGANI